MITHLPKLEEVRAYLEEAKKLQTLFIRDNPFSVSAEISRLQEADLLLEIQRNESHYLCSGIHNSLKALKASIRLETNEGRKLKPDFNSHNLSNNQLKGLIERLIELRKIIDNQMIAFRDTESESTCNILEELEKYSGKTVEKKIKDSDSAPALLQNRLEKQKKLQHFKMEKTQVNYQIAKLNKKILRYTRDQKLLQDRIQEIENHLSERYKTKEENLRNSIAPFDKSIQEATDRYNKECIQNILPLEDEKKQLQETIKMKEVCSPVEINTPQKELHLIFLVDVSETMKEKWVDIEKFINTLLQDRNEQDFYSVILFDEKVYVERKEKKIKPLGMISLPKPNWSSNKAFLKGLKEAYNLINKSSHQCSPFLIILTDCLKDYYWEKVLSKLCKEVEKLYSSFHERGLLVFISYFDLLNQEGLRKIVLSANGGKHFIEGFQDNHDFLNHASNPQALARIIQDLNFSEKFNFLSTVDPVTEAMKFRIQSIQTSIDAKNKLLEDALFRNINKYDELKEITKEKSLIEWEKVTTLYEEKRRELKQEDERLNKCLIDCSQSLTIYENENYKVQQSISSIEKDLQEILVKEQKNLSQHCQNNLHVINLMNIDIKKSIGALRKTNRMLLLSHKVLSETLKTLIEATEQISKKLEDGVIFERGLHTQSHIAALEPEASEGGKLMSLIGTRFQNGMTSQFFSGMNNTQIVTLKNERFHQIEIYQNELLSECQEVQKLTHNFLSQLYPR